jgi:hypothetical protein
MTASHYCNLIPPIFNFLTNLVRFSVCFLSLGVSYPPVSTVGTLNINIYRISKISTEELVLATFLRRIVWQVEDGVLVICVMGKQDRMHNMTQPSKTPSPKMKQHEKDPQHSETQMNQHKK